MARNDASAPHLREVTMVITAPNSSAVKGTLRALQGGGNRGDTISRILAGANDGETFIGRLSLSPDGSTDDAAALHSWLTEDEAADMGWDGDTYDVEDELTPGQQAWVTTYVSAAAMWSDGWFPLVLQVP